MPQLWQCLCCERLAQHSVCSCRACCSLPAVGCWLPHHPHNSPSLPRCLACLLPTHPLQGSCSTPVQQTLHQQTPQKPQQQTPQQHALQQQQTPETPAPAAFWQASGWSFGSHSDQNARAYMEDRSVAIDLTGHAGLPPAERAGLFSVYDGHGGHQVRGNRRQTRQRRQTLGFQGGSTLLDRSLLTTAVYCHEAT